MLPSDKLTLGGTNWDMGILSFKEPKKAWFGNLRYYFREQRDPFSKVRKIKQ